MVTEFRNAVFIKHVVKHQGVSGDGSYIPENNATLSRALDYNAREGEFEWKGGVDHEPTLEDLRLEARKAELLNALQYMERSGIYEGRNPEQPMAEGEVSGGHLWGPRGLVNAEEFIEDVISSKSNVVHSIFTISREWAEDLHLTTKAEFQTFLRGHWTSFAEDWNAIPKGFVDWCAEFHTDADMSVHCHITTFDRSGTFTGRMQIPHDVIETSKQNIRKAVFSEYQAEKNAVKDLMRNLGLNQIKLELGMPVSRAAELSLERKALETGLDLHLVKPDAQHVRDMEMKLEQIVQHLPETGQGRLGAYSVNKEAREAAFSLLEELKSTNPVISQAFSTYSSAVDVASDILGKAGPYRDSYIEKQMHDLETRAANVILRAAGSMNSPWERDTPMRDEFNRVIDAGKAAMTREVVHEASLDQEILKNALENETFKAQSAAFKRELIEWSSEIKGADLLPEQERRIIARVDEAIEQRLASTASYKLSMHERYELMSAGKAAVFTSVQDLISERSKELPLSKEVKEEFEQAFSEVKREILVTGKASTSTLDKAAKVVLSVPEVKANIEKAATKEASITGKSKAVAETSIVRERTEQARAVIEAAAKSEINHDNQEIESKVSLISVLASSLLSNQLGNSRGKAHEIAHSRITSQDGEQSLANERNIGN